jgi:hypothetical protein
MTLNALTDGGVYDDTQLGTGATVSPIVPFQPRIITSPATTVGKVAAAIASQASTTTPNDAQKHAYQIDVVVTITTLGSGSINAEVTYTDDNGTARTKIIPLKITTFAGTMVAAATTADTYTGSEVINCNPNTAITVLTAGTFTGCTYNFWAQITQKS